MKNVEAEAWKPRILMRVVTNNQTVFQRRVTHDSHIKARAPLFPDFPGTGWQGKARGPNKKHMWPHGLETDWLLSTFFALIDIMIPARTH